VVAGRRTKYSVSHVSLRPSTNWFSCSMRVAGLASSFGLSWSGEGDGAASFSSASALVETVMHITTTNGESTTYRLHSRTQIRGSKGTRYSDRPSTRFAPVLVFLRSVLVLGVLLVQEAAVLCRRRHDAPVGRQQGAPHQRLLLLLLLLLLRRRCR